MEKNKIEAVLLIILLCISGHVSSASETYFVRMKRNSRNLTESISSKILYTYKNFDGFSVSLTKDQFGEMKARNDVDFMQKEQTYDLHTTRSPRFMGMEGLGPGPKLISVVEKAASQVIIGVVDTGVWPDSPSLNDAGLRPVRPSWKGGCDKDVASMCNRKLVGARSFFKSNELVLATLNETMATINEKKWPIDTNGHGTHTISTAGGSAFPNASLWGFANGTAQGMAHLAKVSIYKPCWKNGCHGADVLAAIDQAIEDGVDVLSFSMGRDRRPLDYYNDTIAIAAFAATRKGILVCCSAGNDGPHSTRVSNIAPWMLTVAAGTIDRNFSAPLELGNKEIYAGMSLFSNGTGYSSTPLLPMVYARNASTDNSSFCLFGTLDPAKVKGKIVLCDRGNGLSIEKGNIVQNAKGRGMVVANTAEYGDELEADEHLLPATAVSFESGQKIMQYLASARNNATASIQFRGTVLGVEPSPVLARFSSRGGPTSKSGINLLKPDLIAPGVNILAAWPGTVPPSVLPTEERRVKFNIKSGTSMSCSHVSGLAALLKAAHPEWSPAAIRSALMTTAYSTYNNGSNILDAATGKPATPYGIGSGHVQPVAALHPGLVYDLSTRDYCNFMCALKYSPAQIQAMTNITNFTTCKKEYRVSDLNYPSFVVSVEEAYRKGGVTHTRTLTNVGPTGTTSTYKVSVISPTTWVSISVEPPKLTFNKPNEKKSYTVTFNIDTHINDLYKSMSCRIEWSDGKRVVGSPIVFDLP